MRRSTRRGRGTAGLAVADLEERVRRLLPGEQIDFKRLRGYRSDRNPAPVSRPLLLALAEVCGTDPAEALLLLDQALASTPSAEHPSPQEEMCGRAAEFDTCRQVLDAALGGRRLGTVVVVGGPGFGKTLMARALEADVVARARAEVIRVSAATALDDLVARLAGTGSARPARFQPRARDFADELDRQSDLVRDALLARASRCATVVLVDDLHHASGPLIDLLARLADQEVTAALAVVATTRPDPRFFLARSGRIEEAGAVLDDLLGHGLGAIRQDASWWALLALLAEAVALSGATGYAQEVYDALLPYQGQVLVMATGIFCFGAADRFLAMLEPLVSGGDCATAAERYENAIALERKLEAPALTARSLLWFARTMAGDDPEWAGELLADAAAECPPQLRELQQWIAEDQAALARRRRPVSRREKRPVDA